MSRKIGYIVAIIFDFVFLFIANNILDWGFDFIKPSFTDVLWAINLSAVVSILINAVLLIYDRDFVKPTLQVVGNIFALISAYVLVSVFPFDFRELIPLDWINTLARICLWAVIIGIAIGTIAEAVKAVRMLMGRE